MGEVSCYSMHLYCDFKNKDSEFNVEVDRNHKFNEMPWEYTGFSRGDCIKQARNAGWLISRTKYNDDGTRFCLCPKHSGKKRRAYEV